MNYRILFTDDEPLIRKVGVAMLRQLGNTVVECGDALEALDVLHENADFDLLLTDVQMPGGVDGFTLAREALLLNNQIKVIFLSGYTEASGDLGAVPQDLLTCNALFLSKPFKLDQLKQTIKHCFEPVV